MVMESRSRNPLQRAGGGGQSRRYITEHCYVRPDNPDTSYGYPDTAIHNSNINEGTAATAALFRAVFKFSRQLPEKGPTDIDTAVLRIGEVNDGLKWVNIWTEFTNTLDFRLEVHPIREDFDASVLTWNILTGLDQSNAGYVSRLTETVEPPAPEFPGTTTNSSWAWSTPGGDAGGQGLILSPELIKKFFDPDEGEPAYGFWTRGDFFGDEVANVAVGFTAIRTLLKTGTEKYASSMEWY